jgi:hypothetical protein
LRIEYDKSSLSSHWIKSLGRVEAPVAALIMKLNFYKLQNYNEIKNFIKIYKLVNNKS